MVNILSLDFDLSGLHLKELQLFKRAIEIKIFSREPYHMDVCGSVE